VSVAAGFCPIAIGTETAGSVVFPASCNGLYGLKLRPDSAPGDGIFKLSESFDGVGVIARTAMDCVALAGVLMGKEDLSSSFSESWSWSDLRIGVVPNDWGLYPSSKEKWSSQDIVGAAYPPDCGSLADFIS
jgi:amidase